MTQLSRLESFRLRARAGTALALMLCFGLGVLSRGSAAHAGQGEEFVLIVNAENPVREAPREFVAEAFLKKTTRWSSGEGIRPVDLPQDSVTRRRFSDSVLQRSVAAVRSYWQQRIFAGRDVPPPELANDEAVLHYVLKYPGAIGYVSSNTKVAGAKVLLVRPR